MSLVLLVFFLVLLLLFSGFLSASETALFSLSSFTVRSCKQHKESRKRAIYSLLKKPRELMVTILMLNVFAAIVVQNIVSSLFGESGTFLLRVGVPLLLTLFLGEIIPKSLALANNIQISNLVAPIISFVAKLLGPVRYYFTSVTNYISRFLFFFLKKEEEISVEELEELLESSKIQGILSGEEVELIGGYLDLRYATVKELMRPRNEIIYFDLNQPIGGLKDLFINEECTRIPLSNGDIDSIIGILSTRRYLFHADKIEDTKELKQLIKKPFFVPESMRAWSLFHMLREKKEHMAIVVDEYGSISGLITTEDLIEAVVGDIRDLRDKEKKYTRSGENVIIANGKLDLSDFEEIFDVRLRSKEHAITLGGWLIEQLEEIPKAGTKYVNDDFLFYILSSEPNKIKQVYVRRLKQL